MKRLDKYIKESILDTTIDTSNLLDVFKDGIVTNNAVKEVFGSDMEEIILPEGITRIDRLALAQQKKLRKIVLPSTLTSIGEKAFIGCDNLEEVVFHPDTHDLRGIGWEAFEKCVRLTDLNLPDCIESIYGAAFCNTGITSIHIPANLKEWENAFTGLDHVKKIDLSHTKIEEIPEGAFMRCTALEKITLPGTCISIGRVAFKLCTSLKTIHTLNVKTIGKEAFSDCENLQIIKAPKVKTVDPWAFSGCVNLTTIDLARGVSLGDHSFDNCPKLTEFKTPVSDVGSRSFSDTGVSEIYWTGVGEIHGDQITNYDRGRSYNPPIKKIYVTVPMNRLSGKAKNRINDIIMYHSQVEVVLPE